MTIILQHNEIKQCVTLDEVEKKYNTNVISSNQAIIWDCLRLLNISTYVSGYGKLFKY